MTATDEGSLPEIAQFSPYYLPLNVFTASKGSNLYILFMTVLQRNYFTKNMSLIVDGMDQAKTNVPHF